MSQVLCSVEVAHAIWLKVSKSFTGFILFNNIGVNFHIRFLRKHIGAILSQIVSANVLNSIYAVYLQQYP